VHRDIKPENVLLEDGHALVADFGIARAAAAAGDEKLTQTGVTLGTPTYMSPEQAMADKNIDGRADIYSLGCVLYEMLGGQPPFVGPTAHAIIARHAMDTAPSLTIVRNTIPDELEATVMMALSKVPADRFQTAREFADALRQPHGPAARRATTRTRPVKARPSRRTWLIAAAIAVPLLAVGGWFLARQRRAPSSAGAVAGGLDPRHIAVLYFDDNSSAHDLGFVADGLTDALIGQLAEVQGLTVVSKGGVAPFRLSTAPVDSIARVLEAGTLVRGGVERQGDKMRVSVRLVDGSSGADFQRASFDQPAGNFLAMRDSLAEDVARMIRARLGEEVRLRESREGTKSPDAWALVQRAEQARRRGDDRFKAGDTAGVLAAFGEADSLLGAAEQLDHMWAEPPATRAFVQARVAKFLRDDPLKAAPWIDRGLADAERALAIAPQDAEALESRGTVRYWKYLIGLETDPAKSDALFEGARQDLEASVKLAPSRASAWALLSHRYARGGDPTAAKLAARRAYEEDAYLDNADVVVWRLFTISFDLEQFAEATNWCDVGAKRFATQTRFVECRLWILGSPAVPPDVPRAWRLADSLVALAESNKRSYGKVNGQVLAAAVVARAGLGDSARRVLQRNQDTPDIDPIRDIEEWKAYVWSLIGDKDEAIKSLRAYLAANPDLAHGYNSDNNWRWRSLKDDPRFQAMIR